MNSGIDLEAELTPMVQALHARGPDGAGSWFDRGNGVALGHRRLAVLDISPAGHQPMRSPSSRYVIVFNGEIYNHLELRRDLDHPQWNGHSDTETILACIDTWGIERTLKKLIGMFAFAVLDRTERVLHLARDRMGEKPLYYGWIKGRFVFASELRSLSAHPAFEGDVSREALGALLQYACIPAPLTIYRGIHKLLPAHRLTIHLGGQVGDVAVERYWAVEESVIEGRRRPFPGGVEEAVSTLDSLLSTVVSSQMLSDVPVGAFLSGGVDSTTVVALMQANSPQPVNTFTIGFGEQSYDEASHAREVARYLGTHHTEIVVSAKDALNVVPRLPGIFSEPFADSSQIPALLVSRLARNSVTVALSGDGGDEIFCGYNRYVLTDQYWKHLSAIPLPLRKVLAGLLASVSPTIWNSAAHAIASLMPRVGRYRLVGEKIHKVARVASSSSVDEVYQRLVSQWQTPSDVVLGLNGPGGGGEVGSRCWNTSEMPKELLGIASVECMMIRDTLGYLHDDILTKVDRSAMAVSLETRVPLIDKRIVEFAWSLPLTMKLRGHDSKWILRRVLDRYVPRALVDRPKMGFGVPIDSWLRGPLKEWAEALLDTSRLSREGYFNPVPIRRLWEAHSSGRINGQHALWPVLMFQSWLEDQARGFSNET